MNMAYKITGLITALSQIMQTGDQKTGASTLLPVKSVWYDGDVVEVPYISGNSVRGRLRRLIMADMCKLLGDYEFGDPHVWHSFFGGGQLQAIGPGGIIDVGLRKQISKLCPPGALWGFSLGNQVLESKMIVHDMDLLCSEMEPCVTDTFKQYCTESFYSFKGNAMFTRRDDKQDGKVKSDDEAAIQMKVSLEVFIPGSQFYHGFVLKNYPTPVEISCLHRAIKLWQQENTIGGKSSSGFGRVKLEYGVLDDTAYLQFLDENKGALTGFLDDLASDFKERLKKSRKKKKT